MRKLNFHRDGHHIAQMIFIVLALFGIAVIVINALSNLIEWLFG